MPDRAVRTNDLVDLLGRVRFPRVQYFTKLVIAKRLEQYVDMIWHDDILAKRVPLPVEEVESVVYAPANFWTRQKTGTVAGIQHS